MLHSAGQVQAPSGLHHLRGWAVFWCSQGSKHWYQSGLVCMQAVQALQVKVAAAYKALHGPHIAAASKVSFLHSALLTVLMLLSFIERSALPYRPAWWCPSACLWMSKAVGLRHE